MDKEELARRLRETFTLELSDHVGSLTNELLAMESERSPEENAEGWSTIFRVAHTLKGASAIVNLDSIRDCCHEMEEIFGHYRDHNLVMDEKMTSLMLKTVDGFANIHAQMQVGEEVDQSVLDDVLPELNRHSKQIREANQSPTSGPVKVKTPDVQSVKSIDPEPDLPKTPTTLPSVAEPLPSVAEPLPSVPEPLPSVPKPLPSVAGTVPSVAGTVPKVPVTSHASVRVSAQKLDSLLSHTGELLIARGRMALRIKDALALSDFADDVRTQWKVLQQKLHGHRRCDPNEMEAFVLETGQHIVTLSKRLDALATGMESDDRMLTQTCSRLDDEVYNVRMLPFSAACDGLDRVVRDVAKVGGKSVKFKIEGGDVEVDRSVLEGLKDPLLHLIRNAVDHGVESTDQRIAAGKPEQATVTVSASLRGGQVEVLVADDGGGFNLERICKIAHERGLPVPSDRRQQARLVLQPGFSTAELITDISGRGIGLDVVQNQIESLHGQLDIDFEAGRGTRFTMHVPLTLTTIRCMLVRTAGQQFAIPTAAITRLERFTAENIRSVAGRDTLLLHRCVLPLAALSDTFALKATSPKRDSDKQVAIVLTADHQQVAVVVDEVVSEQEVLVKNLGRRIGRLRHFSGCTLLPSGSIALVVNAANVVRSVLECETQGSVTEATHKHQHASKRILLADDSVTTRILLKNILETAGYTVVDAIDGQQALEFLTEHAADPNRAFDAVVSDVDMPRMNGFQLTTRIRQSDPGAEIPVVLVTARGSNEDKKRGILSGADAYIVKDSFDQKHLLKTLSQLV